MSSRNPVSTARPQTFWSIEYGDRLLVSIGRSWSSAYWIAFSRVHAKSRTGAMHRSSGASAWMPTSNRTWSLPLPVQPCATVVAPILRRRLHEVLDDQWPGQRRHQRVAVHVEGLRLERGQAVLLGELVPGVGDDRLDRTAGQCALADLLEILTALADVHGDGDDLGAGLLGDPADAHRGVQAPGVGQYDPVRHLSKLLHRCLNRSWLSSGS